MWYKNIAGRFFGLVTKHTCDRQTDRKNYDSQDCASIAASCGNNITVAVPDGGGYLIERGLMRFHSDEE